MVRQLNDAFNDPNLDAALAHYADDVIYLPPNQQPLLGLAAVRSRDSVFLADYDYDGESSVEEVHVSGDWGFARLSYSEMWTPQAGGDTTSVRGKSIILFRRAPGGSWKVTHWMWSDNSPRN